MGTIDRRLEALEQRTGADDREPVRIAFKRAEPGQHWWEGETVVVLGSLAEYLEWAEENDGND